MTTISLNSPHRRITTGSNKIPFITGSIRKIGDCDCCSRNQIWSWRWWRQWLEKGPARMMPSKPRRVPGRARARPLRMRRLAPRVGRYNRSPVFHVRVPQPQRFFIFSNRTDWTIENNAHNYWLKFQLFSTINNMCLSRSNTTNQSIQLDEPQRWIEISLYKPLREISPVARAISL